MEPKLVKMTIEGKAKLAWLSDPKVGEHRELKLRDVRVRYVRHANYVQCVHDLIDGTITLFLGWNIRDKVNHYRLIYYADSLNREGFSPKEVTQRVRKARQDLFTHKYKFKTA